MRFSSRNAFGSSFSLVELLERGDGILLCLLEWNDIVRAQHAVEAARDHVRAAAVGALGRHGVAVGDEFRAAGGAGLDHHVRRFGSVPCAACIISVPLRFFFLRLLCRLCRLFLFLCIEGIHLGNADLGVAELTGDVVVPGEEGEGGTAFGTFVADACVGHGVTSLCLCNVCPFVRGAPTTASGPPPTLRQGRLGGTRCGRGDWGVHQNFPPPPPWLLSRLELLELLEESFFGLSRRVTVV